MRNLVWLTAFGLAACTTDPGDTDSEMSDTEVEESESESEESDSESEESESEESESESEDSESEESESADSESADSDSDSAPPVAASPLLISEYGDVNPEYKARYIEIANISGADVDLTGWTLVRYSNGGTSGSTINIDTATVVAGDVWVITNTAADFTTKFGFDADQAHSGINGNGNDTFVLVDPTGDEVDILGEIGVDGSGTAWDYLDSVIYRSGSDAANPMDIAQWTLEFWEADSIPAGASPGSYTP